MCEYFEYFEDKILVFEGIVFLVFCGRIMSVKGRAVRFLDFSWLFCLVVWLVVWLFVWLVVCTLKILNRRD